MIHIQCNGKVLEARRVGRVTVRVTAKGIPIKCLTGLYEDAEASAVLRDLADAGLHEVERLREK